jgi:chromosome segregation ATPase
VDGLPKVSIGIIAVVILQIGGFIWWTAQQASTISSLEETVSRLSAQSEVQDKVNMQRDIAQNSDNIDEIIDILAEIYEDLEDTENELWKEIDIVWEDLDGMASHMMEIIKVQSRVKTLEGTLEYLIRSPVHNDAR